MQAHLADDLAAMPLRLVHIVDEHTREDGARLCSLLLRRLPAEVAQQVVVMGARPAGLSVPGSVPLTQTAKARMWPFVALSLHRTLRRQAPDAVIAWSMLAAGSAAGATRQLAAVISDPADARESSRWATALGSQGFELVCTNATVQRRLVESGRPLASTAVIRPGVDFAEIRRAREHMRRQDIGLPVQGRTFVTMPPPSRQGGQYQGVWAAGMLHHIWPDASLIVPGTSREQRRIARLIETLFCRQICFLTGNRYSPAELMGLADGLLVPAVDDVPTGWIAWAMAAGVPVIGSAVPCVTEFIEDRQNGFLCRPGDPHALAVRIRTAFESPELMASCIQTARHQAYETFRAERCVDEFLKLVRNLAAGRPALADLRDAAVDA